MTEHTRYDMAMHCYRDNVTTRTLHIHATVLGNKTQEGKTKPAPRVEDTKRKRKTTDEEPLNFTGNASKSIISAAAEDLFVTLAQNQSLGSLSAACVDSTLRGSSETYVLKLRGVRSLDLGHGLVGLDDPVLDETVHLTCAY